MACQPLPGPAVETPMMVALDSAVTERGEGEEEGGGGRERERVREGGEEKREDGGKGGWGRMEG